jgi:hypothetical protein
MFTLTRGDLLWPLVITGSWIGLLAAVVWALRRLFPADERDSGRRCELVRRLASGHRGRSRTR